MGKEVSREVMKAVFTPKVVTNKPTSAILRACNIYTGREMMILATGVLKDMGYVQVARKSHDYGGTERVWRPKR